MMSEHYASRKRTALTALGLGLVTTVALIGLFHYEFSPPQRPATVLVKIEFQGKWSGALTYNGATKSIEGDGPSTWRVPIEGIGAVGAVIQKSTEHGTLTVSITTEDGRVLARESTTLAYGVVMVSWRAG